MEKGFNIVNNQWNSVQTVIERCIDEGIYEIPAFVPYSLLMQEIINTQLSLYTADPKGNISDISKLSKLFELALNTSNKMNEYIAANTPVAPAPQEVQ